MHHRLRAEYQLHRVQGSLATVLLVLGVLVLLLWLLPPALPVLAFRCLSMIALLSSSSSFTLSQRVYLVLRLHPG